jgi:peptidoglycan/LPS O-acetylase OafA/YrhL
MHTSYFAGIDALRFVAALMVAVFHVLFWSWAGPSDLSSAMFSDKSARYPNVATIASTGWVGVEVFFVISGFVIAQSAENKTWSQYLGGRILRLFPAIWVCATVAVILALLLQVMPWKWALFSYARTLIMMPTPVWIDAVYWTLAVEITFYAMVFVLVLMKKTEKIEWLAIGLGIYTAVYLLLNQNGLLSLPDFTVAKHGVFFSIGILIWLMASQEFRWRRVILIVLFLPIALHEI